MSLVYLSLGSNLKDRLANLQRAVTMLADRLRIVSVSSVYETEPWGDTHQPPFLNICLAATTDFSPRELMQYLKSVEEQLGREPARRWGPRLIDIDILFFEDRVISEPGLIIPHPRIAERAFVLVPLVELGGALRHPETGKSVLEMLWQVEVSGVNRLHDFSLGSDRATVMPKTEQPQGSAS
ncbi:MAG TPA: 2-amino-4-hydroxy-6-hydroxymethyldihydropteridine diphosphokinase [Promineifilum sp.]